MTAPESPVSFSLLGGPLHQMGRRLGLVRGTNTVRLGFALGVGSWLVVVALALVQGVTDGLFTLSVGGGHARLLAAVALAITGARLNTYGVTGACDPSRTDGAAR